MKATGDADISTAVAVSDTVDAGSPDRTLIRELGQQAHTVVDRRAGRRYRRPMKNERPPRCEPPSSRCGQLEVRSSIALAPLDGQLVHQFRELRPHQTSLSVGSPMNFKGHR
jgi:hypothetical protein